MDLAGLPLVRFLLPRTQLRRVPLLHHALPCSRTCGTRIARPSSVPSSGFLPLSTVPASSRLLRGLSTPPSPWPPTLRGLLSCRSRPWSAPPELSLPGEPYPLSRATCFLVGSLSDRRRRSACGRFTAAFPFAPALCRSSPPEGRPGTHEPGRRSLRSLVRSPRRTRRRVARTVHIPPTLGSPVNGRHAHFEALLPPGVRSATTSLTWPG